MKFILLLLFLSGSVVAQDMNRDAFNKYEEQKKDKGVAILLWSVVPGGPHFYTDDGKGIYYLLATVGAVGIAIAETNAGQGPLIGLTTLAGARLFDLITGLESVDQYNTNLRVSLSITSVSHRSLSLCLSLDL